MQAGLEDLERANEGAPHSWRCVSGWEYAYVRNFAGFRQAILTAWL